MKTTNFKKVSAILLAAALLTGLTGCGGNDGSSSTTSTSGSSTGGSSSASTGSSASSEGGTTGHLVSEKPLTLTAHVHNGATEVLNEDWSITKKAAEMTNVSLKGTASVNETDPTNAFNLMITSKDLPDLVGGNNIDLIKYGMEGAFQPLEELIAEHAPNIQRMLDENPDVRAAITAADGHIYLVPTLEDSQASQTWFIRQDWLDIVGKEVPKTVDELYDVLTAFANEDPNGNGKKDEVGFLTRNGFGSDLGNGTSPLFSLFGVNVMFHTNEENKVQLGAYTPEFKDAMKNVSNWYAEDLIDKEVFTRGGTARDVLFSANNGGLVHDWYPSTSSYNDKMQQQVPGFKLVGMLPPTDSNGDQWEVESRQTVTGKGTAISQSNKTPVETIKYLDFWWTEEGGRLMTYGVEGEHHTMVNGEPVFTDTVLKNELPINAYIKSLGGQQYMIGHVNRSAYENFMMSQEGVDVLKAYQDAGVVNKLNPKLPALSFTQEETDLIQSKWPIVSTYILEQIQKWTFDGSGIDSQFDKYMTDIRGMGMDEILAAYQTAYDRSRS